MQNGKLSNTTRIIGIGGMGGKTIECLSHSDIKNVDFIAIDTDEKDLNLLNISHKLLIGSKAINGSGTNGQRIMGGIAANYSRDLIGDLLAGSNHIIIASMYGGTGSGVSSRIARYSIYKHIKADVLALMPPPFASDNVKKNAEISLDILKFYSSPIIIPYNKTPLVETPIVNIFPFQPYSIDKQVKELLKERGVPSMK